MSKHKFPMRVIEWDTVIGEKDDGSDILADSLPVWAYDQLRAAPKMLKALKLAMRYTQSEDLDRVSRCCFCAREIEEEMGCTSDDCPGQEIKALIAEIGR